MGTIFSRAFSYIRSFFGWDVTPQFTTDQYPFPTRILRDGTRILIHPAERENVTYRLQIYSARNCGHCPRFRDNVLPRLLAEYNTGSVRVEYTEYRDMSNLPAGNFVFIRNLPQWFPMVTLIREDDYQRIDDMTFDDAAACTRVMNGVWNSDQGVYNIVDRTFNSDFTNIQEFVSRNTQSIIS